MSVYKVNADDANVSVCIDPSVTKVSFSPFAHVTVTVSPGFMAMAKVSPTALLVVKLIVAACVTVAEQRSNPISRCL